MLNVYQKQKKKSNNSSKNLLGFIHPLNRLLLELNNYCKTHIKPLIDNPRGNFKRKYHTKEVL